MKTPSEIHLFIIWSKARAFEQRILNDLKLNFSVKAKFNVTWSKSLFSENLSRFYGQNLPSGSDKIKHCGDGDFLAVIVEDLVPSYSVHNIGNGRGNVRVNVKTYNLKKKYRDWTGGGHKIHASNDQNESQRDIFLLFGKPIEYFKNYKLKSVNNYSRDTYGINGWDSWEQIFCFLNYVCEYSVLDFSSDFAERSNKVDVDFIVKNKQEFVYLVHAQQGGKKYSNSRYQVKVNGENLPIDIYDIKSKIFDPKWFDILLSRRSLIDGVFFLDSVDKSYAGLYHALYHKEDLMKYSTLLAASFETTNVTELSRILNEFMIEKQYIVIEPEDLTLPFDSHSLSSVKKSIRRSLFDLYCSFICCILRMKRKLYDIQN